ncbi:MAG: hypothetical protein IH945_13970, partial [Armatimonadetes bacterium]|nr:hypothetical protein [Armatimonadota bacterium]
SGPASSTETEPKFSARKSKSRPPKKAGGGRRAAVAREEPKEEEPKRAPRKAVARKRPQEPAGPKREHIPIPDEAAQVIVHEGLPSIVHKMRIIPPLSFCASIPTEQRMETVLEEVRMAAGNGIHMFTLVTDLTVQSGGAKSALDQISGQMAKLSKVDPELLFIVRLNFVAPEGWEKKYKRAGYRTKSGEVAKPSVCDEEYWSDAEHCMTELITSLRKSDKVGVVLGVHLNRSEWFYPDSATYDTSDSAQEEFKRWVAHRYRDDIVSLRAAWFDGAVKFESVSIPPPDASRAGEEFVRTGRKARRWVDYNLFLSDSTVNRIAKLAYAAKKASEGWYMVGVSYGYTFEWSHPANGHLSLGKLLRCPDIDYVAGPPSYKNREPGGSAPFPGPIDSFALNGKLYISEDDFKTPFSGAGTEPDDYNPVMKTPQTLESAHWRSAGAALAHRSGVVWTDSWGNGWLNSGGIWERAGRIQTTMSQRYAVPQGETDVAVLVDERSLAYLVDERAFEVLVQNVRESVLRSGQSAGFYVLSDLAHRENFPEAKLYVFLNAWDIRPEVRSAIKTRLQRDNKVLFWLYCAGLFEAGRESLERVREVTGIALKPQPFHSKTGTTILNSRHPLCAALPDDQMAAGGQLEPSYFAVPEDGMVLGEYSHTGLPSFVVREFTADGDSEHAWSSVFLGEPVVTPGLFRALGQMAGAHVWNFDDDVMHIRRPYLTIHCKGAGQRTITLPNNWSAYSVTANEWPTVEANTVRFNAIDGATYVFLIGLKTDIDAMLDSDIDGLLKIDKLDPRVENTVHWDAVQFDVQIMRLDEWVEET